MFKISRILTAAYTVIGFMSTVLAKIGTDSGNIVPGTRAEISVNRDNLFTVRASLRKKQSHQTVLPHFTPSFQSSSVRKNLSAEYRKLTL